MSQSCAICRADVTYDDFCLGCHHYVCESCDELVPLGPHQLYEHQRFSTTFYDVILPGREHGESERPVDEAL